MRSKAMRFLKTLHGRLTAAYATALFAGLCLFAAVSAFFLIQLYQAVLDARLRVTATALEAIAVESNRGLALDKDDRDQIGRAVSPRLDGMLIRTDGSIVATTAAGVPEAIQQVGIHLPPDLAPTTISAGSDRLRVVAWPVNQDGHRVGSVVVWASTDPLEDFQRLLIVVFGVGIPVLVALAVSGAGFVTRRGLQPVRDIAQLATEIEAHDLSRRLRPQSEDDELGSLSATFDRMLDRLQAAFERQRRFTADASHELRAPLSVIRAEADLALARSRDPEEYRQALESIASEADRIEDLIGDMLALARAESGPPQIESTIDFAPLVADAATRMGAVAHARGVRVEPSIDAAMPVRGDASAIARVPLALVHNGVKYAKPGGCVRVSLTHDPNGEVRLAVRDDGPGFTPEGLRRATERFWKDDQGRGRDGSGLGLAIVRAIVEQSGGTLELNNAPDAGAEVVVTLPAPTA
jgi:signal transduction histidine kinase